MKKSDPRTYQPEPIMGQVVPLVSPDTALTRAPRPDRPPSFDERMVLHAERLSERFGQPVVYDDTDNYYYL